MLVQLGLCQGQEVVQKVGMVGHLAQMEQLGALVAVEVDQVRQQALYLQRMGEQEGMAEVEGVEFLLEETGDLAEEEGVEVVEL